MKAKVVGIGLGLLACAVLVCGQGTPASAAPSMEDFATLNDGAVDAHLVPRYAAFAAAGEGLDEALRRDCADGALNDPASREAYHGMTDGWMAVQHLRFGPSELFLRADRVQFWPDKRGRTGRHLGRLLSEADPAVLEPDRFAKGSVAVQGLPALERLLFALPMGSDPAFACQVALRIGANLKDIAGGLLADWRDGPSAYAAVLRVPPGGNAHYLDAKEASLELVKALRSALLLVADFKLDRPLGKSQKAAKPKRAESWRSARSLRNVRINLAAAEALYAGGSGGIAALVRGQPGGSEIDARMVAGFERAEEKLTALPESLMAALDQPDGWQRLDALRQEVRGLLDLVSGPMSQALDLPLGFNSFDGD
ncbi:imelysin family protein [Pelagibius sp.]|uniref:imelysin family protein n=1 Tax=Pelagibius sp. TaxID=1931238 RepID=UPI00260ACBDB|nr:imelysin family protein [Pelagibius sp.]